jgi:hypothetical protein
MKLKRYGQFVKGINEKESPKYDTIDDFKKQMDRFEGEYDKAEEEGDLSPEDYTTGVKGFDFPADDFGNEDQYDSDEELGDEELGDEDFGDEEFGDEDFGDEEFDEEGDNLDDRLSVDGTGALKAAISDDDMPEDQDNPVMKIYDLAKMLGVEVINGNHLMYGDKMVNFYSETGDLHIGRNRYSTAEEALAALTSGQALPEEDEEAPAPAKAANESRSYRFRNFRK